MNIITKIEAQRNKLSRVNIFVNDEYYCAMQNIVCVKYGLKEGIKIEHDFLDQLTFESDKERALNQVAVSISKTMKTKKQIYDYLTKKGYSPNIIEFVVEKLQEYSYINDSDYVEKYIATYSKKHGKRKLMFDLKQKGIEEEILNSHFTEYSDDTEKTLEIAKKYMKNKEYITENFAKLTNHLAYRGFSYDIIKKTISKLK